MKKLIVLCSMIALCRPGLLMLAGLIALLSNDALADETNRLPRGNLGPTSDGRIVVPTNQVLTPAGRQVLFPGRPSDVVLSPDKRLLAVLSHKEVLTINTESGEITGRLKISGASYKGIVFTPDGTQLLVSTSVSAKTEEKEGLILRITVESDGDLEAGEAISLKQVVDTDPEDSKDVTLSTDGVTRYGANQLPAGMAFSADGKLVYAAINMANRLVEIDLATSQVVRQFPVGNAPYDVALVGNLAYVSNFAGRLPSEDDTTGASGRGAAVKVDPVRHIASEGSVSVVDLTTGKVLSEILVGLHASSISATPDRRFVVVANANSDTMSVIDTSSNEVVETISTRPDPDLPFGSSPNAHVFSPDGKRLYVSNGTNNAIAVFDFAPPMTTLAGLIPTGWYPAGLAIDPDRNSLYVANLKGIGSRDTGWEGTRKVKGENIFGFNTHDHMGSVSLIPIPSTDELKHYTANVETNNRQTLTISALAPPRPDAPTRVVPERHGEPSVFKHVLYIIKENRTYDQVFGDLPEGEGDPSLCIYGEEVTPNHHQLAKEFVLLDNFYCSGVLSADGHQWTDEAYVTSYIEKAFGGFPRSYPYDGGDALAYASSGFLWDNVLAHQKTLRVYGEFVSASIRWKDPALKGRPRFLDCYHDFLGGNQKIDIRATATIKSIEPHLCPTFIGFPSIVPDVHRAGEFIKELKEFEKQDSMPNFMIMLLPNDHTAGTTPGMPTPEAAVADNDLALGRVVDAVSHSKFWKDTCIFVVQDDPQNGFDHIDGHRTVAMVISPYTKRKVVDSTNYNQTSMVRTIELLLGLPPMNQLDASAIPMTSCFTDTPDLAPYTAVPNNIPLDRINPELAEIKDPRELHWANVSLESPLEEVDEADEDTLNRILWFAAKRRDDTYPAWAVLDLDEDDNEEQHQFPIGEAWARTKVNCVIFRKNALCTHQNVQYAAYYNPEGRVVLARRDLNNGAWTTHTTQYTGKVTDAHNCISLAVDGDGFLHVSWDHHANPLRYCRSVAPGSLQLTDKLPMVGSKEKHVTYPEFYALPNGDLLFFYRDGGSGNGDLVLNRYDVAQRKWERVQDNLLGGQGERNAYWQVAVDRHSAIHLSWVWRETGNVVTNHDIAYARSIDGGMTWTNTLGDHYTLPIVEATAEYAIRIPQNSELANQTSMAIDYHGHPYIANFWRDHPSSVPQYRVVYHDGTTWKTTQVGNRTLDFHRSGGGTKRPPISRPVILLDSNENRTRTLVLFRDLERERRLSVAISEDLDKRAWEIYDLTAESVGQSDPVYDPQVWQDKREIHLLTQFVGQGDGETQEDVPPQTISVIEWIPPDDL